MFRKLQALVIVFALATAGVAQGDYTILAPRAAIVVQSGSVLCDGAGTADPNATLLLRIYRDGTFKNHAYAPYTGGTTKTWAGTVAPPTGGFGPGAGALKIWVMGEDITTVPEHDSSTFTFM